MKARDTTLGLTAAAMAGALCACAQQSELRESSALPETPAAQAQILADGKRLIAQGQIGEGADILEAWLAHNPANESAVFMLAQALAAEGEAEHALRYAEQAFELAAPPEDRHVDLLAYLYQDLGMAEQRETILAQRPDRAPILLNR